MRQGIGEAAQKAAWIRQFQRHLGKLIAVLPDGADILATAELFYAASKLTPEAAAAKYVQTLQICNDCNIPQDAL